MEAGGCVSRKLCQVFLENQTSPLRQMAGCRLAVLSVWLVGILESEAHVWEIAKDVFGRSYSGGEGSMDAASISVVLFSC